MMMIGVLMRYSCSSPHVVNFFKKLYSLEYLVSGLLLCRGRFHLFSSIDKDSLSVGVGNEEVRKEVFAMAPWKAPGVDRFHARFY